MWLLHSVRLILFYDQIQVVKIQNKVKFYLSSLLGPKFCKHVIQVVQEEIIIVIVSEPITLNLKQNK